MSREELCHRDTIPPGVGKILLRFFGNFVFQLRAIESKLIVTVEQKMLKRRVVYDIILVKMWHLLENV